MIYDENYGDKKLCKCGHPYYRHFDTYDDMKNVGCKYCGWQCKGFDAVDGNNPTPLVFSRDHRVNVAWLREHAKQFGDFGVVQVNGDIVRIYGCDVVIVLTADGDWYLEETQQYDETDRYIGEPE